MIKVNAVILSCVVGGSAIASPVSAAIDPAALLEKCKPLLDQVAGALDSRKKKTALESTAITGGGSLSDASCVDNLLDFEFDSFTNINGFEDLMGGLFSSLQNEAKDNLKNMACDFADDLKEQSNTFISCTANLSVDLGVAAGLSAPTMEACFGTGISDQGYNFNFQGGEGSNSLERRFGSSVSTGSNQGNSSSATNLLNSLEDKVDQMNESRR
mgnify:CR=1 FL=1